MWNDCNSNGEIKEKDDLRQMAFTAIIGDNKVNSFYDSCDDIDYDYKVCLTSL